MALDITFYAKSNLDPRYIREIGYFYKVKFLLTYFNINDKECSRTIDVTHDQLHTFVEDLKKEIENFNNSNYYYTPDNIKFLIKKPNSSEYCYSCYDYSYWEDLKNVYNCVKEIDEGKHIDWYKDGLQMTVSY